jgi:ATP-dependent helicase/nuclease subunit A
MSNWDTIMARLDPVGQLPAVIETRNAVVSAGAGSGKTRVLAVRYLYLIKHRHIHPSRIACLTFTNKASAEMRERIRGMLEQCAQDDPDFAQALEAFPASCVSTLDSLCSEIARNGCSAWGIPSDFGIDEPGARNGTRLVAMEFLLAGRTKPAVASYLAANGFEMALESLQDLAAGREGLLGRAAEHFDDATQTVAITAALKSLHTRIADLLYPGRDLDTGTAALAAAWQAEASNWPPQAAWTGNPASDVLLNESYSRLAKLRKPGGKTSAAQYFNAQADSIRTLAAAAAAACTALSDPDRPAALAFAKDFLILARQHRIASGALSFADVAAIARETLLSDHLLRSWYQQRFDIIMVDEFQDDNELQKEILYLLAAGQDSQGMPGPEDLTPGKLFFVGDEKQSIYAFRNADVTVFRGLANELRRAPDKLGVHHLEKNWRSEPALIDFFNRAFSRIMPAPDEPNARIYEARFDGLRPGPPTAGVYPEIRYIETLPGDDDSFLSPVETQAWRVAELIRELVDGGVAISATTNQGKCARPSQYEDIAILFRSSAAQNTYERFLRLLGIPYSVHATAGLFVESILGDLYAVLRVATYPNDRAAQAAVLRGPFAGLSDDSIFRILEMPWETTSDWPTDTPNLTLPADDARRWSELGQTIGMVRQRADRDTIASILTELWYTRGLRWSVIKRPANAAYLEHFDYAWSLAAAADARGLRLCDFIAELECRIGEVEKMDDSPVLRESARGVALMTIHASKGLEFPVVIVPGIENTGRRTAGQPIAIGDQFGPSIRLLDGTGSRKNPVAELEKLMTGLNKHAGPVIMDQELAETTRLFYVACTRAISRLYLCAKVPSRADEEGRSFRGLLLRVWPQTGPANLAAIAAGPPQDQTVPFVVEHVPPRSLSSYHNSLSDTELDSDTKVRAVATHLAGLPSTVVAVRRSHWSVTAAAAAIETSHPVPLTDGLARFDGSQAMENGFFGDDDFGTLCHELTDTLLTDPDGRPPFSRDLERKLARLSQANREQLLASALILARGFIGSARARAAMAARDAADRAVPGALFQLEYGFTWCDGTTAQPIFLNGSIDLVYGDSREITVVDFKTDRVIRPEQHAFQLAVYRDAASDMFKRPARCFIYYLRHGIEHEILSNPQTMLHAKADFLV